MLGNPLLSAIKSEKGAVKSLISLLLGGLNLFGGCVQGASCSFIVATVLGVWGAQGVQCRAIGDIVAATLPCSGPLNEGRYPCDTFPSS